jgi:mannose-6-phosphate isomerase
MVVSCPGWDGEAMAMAESGEAGRVSVVRPRLDEKPWGGRELARYGLDLPAGAGIGEALVTADEATIVSGAGAGRTLGEVVAAGPGLLGEVASAAVHGRAVFPLLVKLIDARENLSIQVHPNDEQAVSHDRLGKTEAWHVLAAEPGASLYLGLRDGVAPEAFQEAAARLDGSSSSLLRRVEARPGATVLIPAGTVHALGAGVLVYEIQQPSDVTYRLDDWGRVDAEGNPREMHLDEGFAVMRPEARPEWIDPVDLAAREGRRHLLAACRQFALERIALPAGGGYALPRLGGPQVVTILEGSAEVGGEHLATGWSAVAWPGGAIALWAETPVVALRGWVPDLAADLPALTRLSGAERPALEALGGPLPDVRLALG